MRTFALLTAGLVTAAAVAAPAAAGREDHKNKLGGNDTVTTYDCEDADDKIVVTGAPELWPPNHKYSDYLVSAIDGDGDDNTVSQTTAVTHDEYLVDWIPASQDEEEPEEEVGAGNTQQDARPFFQMGNDPDRVDHPVQIRAERSGRGDGRTYTFHIDASFDGEACEATFEASVPHDMRSENAPAKEDKTGTTGPDQDGDDTES